jgi:dTMP kinase
MTQTRGPYLIAVEGLDGAGTTTQCHRLVAWMRGRGRRVWATAEPSLGPVGSLIRQILKGGDPTFDRSALALLFAADRLDHLQCEILPHLAAGDDVVTDRYVASSLAYQSLDADLAWVRAINQAARHADLTLYVRVPVDVCLQRMAGRSAQREVFEERDVLMRVSAGYEAVLSELRAVGAVEVIDGVGSPDEVGENIQRAMEALLGS